MSHKLSRYLQAVLLVSIFMLLAYAAKFLLRGVADAMGFDSILVVFVSVTYMFAESVVKFGWLVLVVPLCICIVIDGFLSLFKVRYSTKIAVAASCTVALVFIANMALKVVKEFKPIEEPPYYQDSRTFNPLHDYALIDQIPSEWKALKETMIFEDAKAQCEEMGQDWRLPSRDELMVMVYEIDADGVFGTYKHAGMKTDDPSMVVTLNPLERTAGPDFKNRVVCVRGSKPFVPLTGDNWQQVPAIAHFYQAKELCEELGEGWDLPDKNQMTKIFEEVPPEAAGMAWTKSVKEKLHPDIPGHILKANLLTKEFETESSLTSLRHLVFCYHN